jgi:hypothetical protein
MTKFKSVDSICLDREFKLFFFYLYFKQLKFCIQKYCTMISIRLIDDKIRCTVVAYFTHLFQLLPLVCFTHQAFLLYHIFRVRTGRILKISRIMLTLYRSLPRSKQSQPAS